MMNDNDLADRVKSAITSIYCPQNLEFAIRARIAARQPKARVSWFRPLAAAGFSAMLLLGVVISFQTNTLRNTAESQEQFISEISTHVPVLLRAGLQDHVHCTVFRKVPSPPPSAETLANTIGPRFAGLIGIVQQHVPSSFQVISAHQCRYRQTRFVHVALTDGIKLMSLVLSPSAGRESLSSAGLLAATSAGGVPLFAANSNRFHIAAFEQGAYVAYLVSDLPAQQNLEIAAAIAPAVGRLL